MLRLLLYITARSRRRMSINNNNICRAHVTETRFSYFTAFRLWVSVARNSFVRLFRLARLRRRFIVAYHPLLLLWPSAYSSSGV